MKTKNKLPKGIKIIENKNEIQNIDELSKSIFGIKYYNLNEYNQDIIKNEIKGLKDLMKDIENK
jgi:hypothetical protein